MSLVFVADAPGAMGAIIGCAVRGQQKEAGLSDGTRDVGVRLWCDCPTPKHAQQTDSKEAAKNTEDTKVKSEASVVGVFLVIFWCILM